MVRADPWEELPETIQGLESLSSQLLSEGKHDDVAATALPAVTESHNARRLEGIDFTSWREVGFSDAYDPVAGHNMISDVDVCRYKQKIERYHAETRRA